MSSCLLSRLSQSAGGGDELCSAMNRNGVETLYKYWLFHVANVSILQKIAISLILRCCFKQNVHELF